MSQTQTLPDPSNKLTQHAMLVIWGLYGRQIGLVQALGQVKLNQKTYTHSPQTKVLEFLVAILAGFPHLQDISRSAHPLDQDEVVAEAWGQAAWADYSGVSRTLQSLTEAETRELIAAIDGISQPFIEQEVSRALAESGRLVYDADLTGRPVSSSSSSYPDTAFGYMGDTISLGYQAALVSLHSPTYGRLWLSNQLHPGDTVSMTQAQALVSAAEQRTGRRPRRRTELSAQRLATAETRWQAAQEQLAQSEQRHKEAQTAVSQTSALLHQWQSEVARLDDLYAQQQRQPTAHCQLTRARRKVQTYTNRLPRRQNELAVAQRRLARHQKQAAEARQQYQQLQTHHQQLLLDNEDNPHPVEAIFRLDGGFASRDNIYWLIEMGYEIYTRCRSTTVRDQLLKALTSETSWLSVGRNASLTAWADTTAEGYFDYPLDIALARYDTPPSVQHALLLHYGSTPVTDDLDLWFHTYNARQTIEAGIKEGKNVFQMHHLKVRSPCALRLQEHFASFAANFVRFAAHWLVSQIQAADTIPTHSVKDMVQVAAHTSAWVSRQGDVWLLTFTEQSCYAGISLRFGSGVVQPPLPFKDFYFSRF